MLRLFTALTALLLSCGAFATQLDDTLCKERPELCPGRGRPSQPPAKMPEPPVKKEAPSGPGWTLIEGTEKDNIQGFLLQTASATSYRNCKVKNGTKLEMPSGPWASLSYILFGRILELNNNSERPLFRIQRGFDDGQKYETYITTTPDRTQILNITVNAYTEQETSYYVPGLPLDKPQVAKIKPKNIQFSVNCDSM